MTNEVHELTPAGRIRKPSYSLVCWWEKVEPSLIRKSFKFRLKRMVQKMMKFLIMIILGLRRIKKIMVVVIWIVN